MWRLYGKIALVSAVAVLLGGCGVREIHSGTQGNSPGNNEVPIATNFQTSTQLKLQAAEHWRRIAQDAAQALVKSFRDGGACIPRSGCTTLHLRRACETAGCWAKPCDTVFNRVFFEQFLTALVNLGYQVSVDTPAAAATIVDIDIQAVAFAADRTQYRYAGEPVAIGPGIWALADVTTLVDKDGNAAIRTVGAETNWYRTEFAAGATPRNELVVTVSALSPQKAYVARKTSVYYTSDGDEAHYSCTGGSYRGKSWTIPVTGDCTGPRCTQVSGGARR